MRIVTQAGAHDIDTAELRRRLIEFGHAVDAIIAELMALEAAALAGEPVRDSYRDIMLRLNRAMLRRIHGTEPSQATLDHFIEIGSRMARLAGGIENVPGDVLEAEARWYLAEAKRRRRMT